MKDTNDHFAKKFSPLVPFYIMSRSYKKSPECDPNVTLFDCWKDRFVLKPSTDHNLLHHLALQVMFVSIDVDLRAYRRGPCSCLKTLAIKLCVWETPSRCLFWSTEFFFGRITCLGFHIGSSPGSDSWLVGKKTTAHRLIHISSWSIPPSVSTR